tara:strand:+ start:119 stop:907 length:789 start_codon:yes stop_codon:yes gene_type:complete
MAVNFRAHNFGNNRVGGEGIGSNAGQGIYEESSTARYPIGEKLELADGRVFRYGYTAGAINRGLLVSQDVSATSVVETDGGVVAASGDYSPAAGSSMVEITLSAGTENQYAGGYLQITDDNGEGHQYRIKSNTARGTTSSGNIGLTLYDPIEVALDATATDFAIVGNPWYNVVGATAGTDYIIAGVTPISFTANYYGWFQTAGIATILSNGAVAIAANLTLSDDVTGAVQLKDAETEPLVGFACYASDDTGHVGVVLQGLIA